jgi:hypothetical protein
VDGGVGNSVIEISPFPERIAPPVDSGSYIDSDGAIDDEPHE